jgi:hypothetical protein
MSSITAPLTISIAEPATRPSTISAGATRSRAPSETMTMGPTCFSQFHRRRHAPPAPQESARRRLDDGSGSRWLSDKAALFASAEEIAMRNMSAFDIRGVSPPLPKPWLKNCASGGQSPIGSAAGPESDAGARDCAEGGLAAICQPATLYCRIREIGRRGRRSDRTPSRYASIRSNAVRVACVKRLFQK